MRNSRLSSNGLTLSRQDLDKLKIDIAQAFDLLKPRPTLYLEHDVPATDAFLLKSRFSRLTSQLRFVRKRSAKSCIDTPDENQRLLDARRGSAQSDETLVESDDTASDLLDVLGPLVATLQRLRARIALQSKVGQQSILTQAEEVCALLLRLIEDQQTTDHSSTVDKDDHDVEMRSLMLSALLKKVTFEQTSFQHLQTSSSPGTIPLVLAPRAASTLLIPTPLNPLIFHQNSLTRPLNLAQPRSIPIANQSYLGFAGNAQQSAWAANVIRLGSYQNSLLFSNSPVAVRRMVSTGGVA